MRKTIGLTIETGKDLGENECDDGTYQVQWTDQTIKHTTDGTNGWSRTITVKQR